MFNRKRTRARSKLSKIMENQNENLKPITWQELADFIAKIPEEKMNDTAKILFQDESSARDLLEPFFIENDIFMYDDNEEDCGTENELREIAKINGEDFDKGLCKLVTKKGAPFLWAE